MKRYLLLLVLAFFSFACDKDDDYDKEKAVSAFVSIDPIRLDESLANVEIKIPSAQNINFWSGSAALQNQKLENFALDFSIVERGFFTKRNEISLDSSSVFWMFYAGSLKDHFVFSPVFKDNKIFTFDTAGVLSAIDLESEKRLWKKRVFEKSFLKNYKSPRIG